MILPPQKTNKKSYSIRAVKAQTSHVKCVALGAYSMLELQREENIPHFKKCKSNAYFIKWEED